MIPDGPVTRVLGVDGGQSGIRLRHSLDDRIVEVEGVGHQEGDTIAAVATAVSEGWHRGGFGPVDRVVLGLTTAPADADGRDRLCRLLGSAVGASQAGRPTGGSPARQSPMARARVVGGRSRRP